ncbi:hypothetical protein K9M79_06060 [Candidatus Woesearchaeota archaeon]|nr:hypothetical protein [Candidatus Woesearchaeota archaeon]
MNTTISIPKDMKEELREFGIKGETYELIIRRLIDKAKDKMVQDILMDTTDSIPIDQAIKEAKNRWQK